MNVGDKIKQTWLGLRTGWSLMRVVRFGLAVAMFVEAYRTGDWLYIALGAFLSYQAVFNTGCCTVYQPPGKGNKDAEVVFEEVKQK